MATPEPTTGDPFSPSRTSGVRQLQVLEEAILDVEKQMSRAIFEGSPQNMLVALSARRETLFQRHAEIARTLPNSFYDEWLASTYRQTPTRNSRAANPSTMFKNYGRETSSAMTPEAERDRATARRTSRFF